MTNNSTTPPSRIHPLTVWVPVIFIALGVVLFYNYLVKLSFESKQNHLPILSRLEKNLALDERSGKRVELKDLKGKIIVASWVYTHCPRGCAGVVSEMRSAFNDLKKSAGKDADAIQFLSFSLDPADTPKDMKEFTDKFKIEGDNWWFLTGPKDELRPYMSKYFGFHEVEEVPVEKRFSPDDKFVHDMRVVLVDDKAQVRGFYDIASPEKDQREFMQEKLRADVLKLLQERSKEGGHSEMSFILYVLLAGGSIAILVWRRFAIHKSSKV